MQPAVKPKGGMESKTTKRTDISLVQDEVQQPIQPPSKNVSMNSAINAPQVLLVTSTSPNKS